MEVCHHCGGEVRAKRIANRNEKIPRFCAKIECQKARQRAARKLYIAEGRVTKRSAPTGMCANCGAPMMKRALMAWCKECRSSAGVGLRESGVKVNRDCVRCPYNANCAERVKIGLWVVCERIDERDIQAAQLSPHYDRMVELIAEARAV